jgi:hypothetical protein
MRNISRTAILAASCVLSSGVSLAQFGRGGGTWNTAGADAQRTAWARTDGRISATSMPGFAFLWKVKTSNDAKQQYSLSSAVMVDSYIGYRGFRSYAFFGGASNNAIALDSDVGRVEWTQNFGATGTGTTACPGAMSAGVTRTATLAPAAAPAGRGGGAGRGGAASGVSAPEAGAITIGQGRGGGFGGAVAIGASGGRGAQAGFGAGGGSGRGGGGGGGARPPEALYAVSTDGMLRTIYISNGTNAKPPVRFLPANAHATGLIFVDNIAYAATTGNCGGVPNGIWAMDTSAASPTAVHWATNGGGVAGTVGPALGADGTVYAATGDGEYSPAALSDSVVALEAKTLKLKDWFTPGKSDFTSSPTVFSVKDGDKTIDVVAVANKNGQLYLLNAAALGGADHKTPMASIQYPGTDAGALASWEDPSGTRWVLVPGSGAIAAYKVTVQGGKATFQTGWTSPSIASPLPPIVINGFVFTAASGSGAKGGVLYALDGVTGKEMFNSGSTIAGPIPHSSGLAGSAGQIYVSTADSTIYTFGIPLVPPALAEKNK